MAYSKQKFVDRVKNGSGEVVVEGTTLRAEHLNHMEEGVAQAVSYTEQELTDEQKAQARVNIGAADATDVLRVAPSYAFSYNGAINKYGNLSTSALGYVTTDYIPLQKDGLGFSIYYKIKTIKNLVIGLYDVDKNWLFGITNDFESLTETDGVISYSDFPNAHYVRFSTTISSSNIVFGQVLPCNIQNIGLVKNGVSTEKLADAAVTVDKIAFLTHQDGTNFINKSALTENAYVNENGEIKTYSGFYLTEYIKLAENTDYYHSSVWLGYYAFYDAEYNLLHAAGNDRSLANPFQIPTGAVYGRFTMTSAESATSAWIHTINKEPPEYGVALDGIGINFPEVKPTEYEGDDICVFAKGICIGDSLTAGSMNYSVDGDTNHYAVYDKYSFPRILERMTGVEITNMGNSGKSSNEWYAAEQNSDVSGHDFAIIQLGVNDSIRYAGWTEASVTGFTNIINKLKAENKNIKIFVATIMPAFSYKGTKIDAVSQGIRDFVTALNDKDVILLDMAVYGHTNDSMAYNCGHLSAYGYWRLAKDYKAYISWYINNNKMDFREVQFIGTDYVYSAN